MQYYALNKARERTVLLIHGLFTGEGFWLQYLHHFKNFKIIVLRVDYPTLDLEQFEEQFARVLENEGGSPIEVAITHSLGCVLTEYLIHYPIKSFINIAPVTYAQRVNEKEFKREIRALLGGKANIETIEAELKVSGTLIAQARLKAETRSRMPSECDYLPDQDEYFIYKRSTASRFYNGNHFQIESALVDIVRLIG